MDNMTVEMYAHYIALCDEYKCKVIEYSNSAWEQHYNELNSFDEELNNGGRAIQ